MINKFLNIYSRLNAIITAKKIWKKPPKKNVLIYDRCGSEIILEYFQDDEVEIMDVRGESINMFIFFKCLFTFRLSGGDYAKKYINYVKPVIVITFIDNNPRFYEIKKSNEEVITIFLQNGWRGITADIFGLLKSSTSIENYHVDYMLTFNDDFSKMFKKYLKGEALTIGSIKNNYFQKKYNSCPNTLLFISQFRTIPKEMADETVFVTMGGMHVTWNEFYSAERSLLPFLINYCKQKKLQFKICGALPDAVDEEKFFYEKMIGKNDWEYIPRKELFGSYKEIEQAEMIVGIDSTLAYESAVRGKKTAIFSIRSNLLNDSGWKFGWPTHFPDSGLFWSNMASESEYKRVLDNITSLTEEKWQESSKDVTEKLIKYDPGNLELLALLNNLGININKKYRAHV